MEYHNIRGTTITLTAGYMLWPNKVYRSTGGGEIKYTITNAGIVLGFLLIPYIKAFPYMMGFMARLKWRITHSNFAQDVRWWRDELSFRKDFEYRRFKEGDKWPYFKWLLIILFYSWMIYNITNLDTNKTVTDTNTTEVNTTIVPINAKDVNVTVKPVLKVDKTVAKDVNVTVKPVLKAVKDTSVTVKPVLKAVKDTSVTVKPVVKAVKDANVSLTTIELIVSKALTEMNQTVPKVVKVKVTPVVKKHVTKKHVVKKKKHVVNKKHVRNSKRLIRKLKSQYPKSTIDDIFKEFE